MYFRNRSAGCKDKFVKAPDALFIFLAPPSLTELKDRLVGRGQKRRISLPNESLLQVKSLK